MQKRGTKGAYRKEDRVALPQELQKELVEKAAAKCGNCQELAKHLNLPKSSVHYYRVGRLTMPTSVLEEMLAVAGDDNLRDRIRGAAAIRDRLWAIEHAKGVFIDMCREKVRLPSREALSQDEDLRRKVASIVSYILSEGSVWMQNRECGEYAANITFSDQETDLYKHFRILCRSVFNYDIGPPQKPGNNAKAIRGFIYSRFVAEALIGLGAPAGDKASIGSHLPDWVMGSTDRGTWAAALQPLLDGEGCVRFSSKQGLSGFSFSQSRHTDLDLEVLRRERSLGRNGRTLPTSTLRKSIVFGMSAMDYCSLTSRSGLLDDAVILLRRLGMRPKIGISSLYLKDDGFWSCNWRVFLSKADAPILLKENLVMQETKRYGIELMLY